MKIEPKIRPVTEDGGQFGSLHLNTKGFPCLDKVDVGDEFEMEVKVRVIEKHYPIPFEQKKLGLTPKHRIYHLEVIEAESPEEEIMEMKMESMKKDMKKPKITGKGY